jgi:hypothetical protein
MKYRYVIDFCDYECSYETVVTHDTKYTQEEFDAICKECIKESLLTKLSTESIPAMVNDGEIVQCVKYDFDERVSAWGDNNYTHMDYVAPSMFKLLELKGFEIESLPMEARFYANEYTYIRENFSEEMLSVFNRREEAEKFPILSDEKAHELCCFLESNAKTVEEAISLIKQWAESNK